MLYNIYYMYNYYYYIYYCGTFYYGLRFSYDTYYTINYIYCLLPNFSKEDNQVTIELYELEKDGDWIILNT